MSAKEYAKHSLHGHNWRLVVKNSREMLAKRNIDDAQQYVDSEVLRRCTPFVPFSAGELIRSGIEETKIGSGEVKYRTPYARRWYYERARFFGAPMRGNYWFERMKAAGGKRAIFRGALKIMGAKDK